MATIEALRNQIRVVQDLQSIVKTMKTLAGVHIRQCEEAVASLREFYRTVELGLQIVLRDREVIPGIAPTTGRHLGAIILGSDQGMVGQFNQEIGRYAMDQLTGLAEKADRLVLTIGARVKAWLEDEGQPVEMYRPMPTSVAGIVSTVQEILFHVEYWRVRQHVGRILLFYHQPEVGAAYHPTVVRLLPLDPHWLRELQQREWPSRVIPEFRMDWEQLLAELIRNFLFVSLYRGVAASMTSENASRLAAMEAAERNIRDRLRELNARYRRQRQSSITEELIDIVAGFETIRQGGAT